MLSGVDRVDAIRGEGREAEKTRMLEVFLKGNPKVGNGLIPGD